MKTSKRTPLVFFRELVASLVKSILTLPKIFVKMQVQLNERPFVRTKSRCACLTYSKSAMHRFLYNDHDVVRHMRKMHIIILARRQKVTPVITSGYYSARRKNRVWEAKFFFFPRNRADIISATRCFWLSLRFSRLATGEERSESAAEESRDSPFLRFSSFPPFIRAPVVDLRPVSWFLLCHTRPYTYIHRRPSFYTGLSVGLYYG